MGEWLCPGGHDSSQARSAGVEGYRPGGMVEGSKSLSVPLPA
jgi:hypothetical protein